MSTLPGKSHEGISNRSFVRMMGVRLDRNYELTGYEVRRLWKLAKAYVVWGEPDVFGNVINFSTPGKKSAIDAIREAVAKAKTPNQFTAEWQAKSPRAPIYLNFAMNIMFNSALAKERLGEAHWDSIMGRRVREWLVTEGLCNVTRSVIIQWGVKVAETEEYEITDKGRAWIEHACGTPMPKREVVSVKEEVRWVRG